MIEAADPQQLLLSRIIRSDDGNAAMVTVLDSGITEAFFSQERWLQVWKWTYGYWIDHGTVPEFAAYSRRFPGVNFKLVETNEPLSALINEVRDKRKYDIVLEGVQETVEHFSAEKVDEALAAMSRLLTTVNAEISHSTVLATNLFISRFIVEVLERKPMSLLGIPTGFPTIDKATGGLQEEQLITLIGTPKTGKTSIALAIAIAAQRYGKRVLFRSFEMAVKELQERYLSIGAEVDLNAILRGELTPTDIEKLHEFESEVHSFEQPLLFVHDMSMSTLGRVAAEIEQHRPDMVVIDGAYLMDDELGERQGSPQALTNITRGAKRLAQKAHIPVFMTTQALYSRTSKRHGPDAESVGYSSSFAQDSDTLMATHREDEHSPRSKLSVILARSAMGTSTYITFDYNLGIIAEEGGGGGYIAQAQALGDGE